MRAISMLFALSWIGLWFTPDQLGQRYYRQGRFAAAAETFRDPLWKGVAEFRAGDFEQASRTFARVDSAEGHYDRGNAQVMLGKYDAAIASYDRALDRRPGWRAAEDNRALARARAELLELKGGDMTEGKLGADEIVFDDAAGSEDQTTEVAGSQPLSDGEIQALWLRRVRTRPSDFLKSKFAYQLARRGEEPGD